MERTALDVWEQLEQSKTMLMSCSGRVRSAALNALDHMEKARALADIDPQMACFRAICAEEEAATSVLASLRDQGYPLSDKYHLWSHENKIGVAFLIQSVVEWYKTYFDFDQLPFGKPIFVTTDEPGRPAIEIVLPIKGAGHSLRPRPPLHVQTQGATAFSSIIGNKLRELVKRKLHSEIKSEIKGKANARNLLLYATDKGLPGCFPNVPGYLLNQAAIVSAMIMVIGLVDPWRKPHYELSGLVQAVLEEYVAVMSSGRKQQANQS